MGILEMDFEWIFESPLFLSNSHSITQWGIWYFCKAFKNYFSVGSLPKGWQKETEKQIEKSFFYFSRGGMIPIKIFKVENFV